MLISPFLIFRNVDYRPCCACLPPLQTLIFVLGFPMRLLAVSATVSCHFALSAFLKRKLPSVGSAVRQFAHIADDCSCSCCLLELEELKPWRPLRTSFASRCLPSACKRLPRRLAMYKKDFYKTLFKGGRDRCSNSTRIWAVLSTRRCSSARL